MTLERLIAGYYTDLTTDMCVCGHSRWEHYCHAGNCTVGEVNDAEGHRPFVGADGCTRFQRLVRQSEWTYGLEARA